MLLLKAVFYLELYMRFHQMFWYFWSFQFEQRDLMNVVLHFSKLMPSTWCIFVLCLIPISAQNIESLYMCYVCNFPTWDCSVMILDHKIEIVWIRDWKYIRGIGKIWKDFKDRYLGEDNCDWPVENQIGHEKWRRCLYVWVIVWLNIVTYKEVNELDWNWSYPDKLSFRQNVYNYPL